MTQSLIADKVRDMPPSGIRKFFDIATEMKGAISLGVGEPDFETPWHVREEGIYSLEKGRTIYTANAGLIELREEIHNYLYRRYNLSYEPKKQILTTVGASEGIDLAIRAVVNLGDEVIIPEPSFVSYKPCVVMAGGIPIVIQTKAENQFRLMPEELEKHITKKTKAIIIPYPNNPTGAIMEKADLENIAKVLRDKNILIISDEIYSELTYTDNHVSIASIDGMYEKTVVINGFSKAYAMTGWRLGYVAGQEDIIAAMTKIHQYIIMCAPTTSQYAGIEALKNGQEDIATMLKAYNARRKLMVKGFRDMGLDCFEPLGAFYVFPSIQKTGLTTDEFVFSLLKQEKVAVVPGNAFGECGEGFIRCSYAYSVDNLNEALKRIKKFVSKYITL